MNRPLVALACSTETWDGVPHAAVRRAYVTALEQVADCSVVLLPGPDALPDETLSRFDGLVLGGHESNVAPAHYAGPPAPGPYDPDRDALALSTAPRAVAAGLPLLGICRGLQEMNVAYGGTLRDLGPTAPHREDLALPRDQQYLPAHEIWITPGGRLHQLLGTDRTRVNSLHGQAIDRLAPGMRAEAVALDGVLEAVSVHPAQTFALGVQWHPEWYAATDAVSRRVFEGFGAAAADRAIGRTRRGRTAVGPIPQGNAKPAVGGRR